VPALACQTANLRSEELLVKFTVQVRRYDGDFIIGFPILINGNAPFRIEKGVAMELGRLWFAS